MSSMAAVACERYPLVKGCGDDVTYRRPRRDRSYHDVVAHSREGAVGHSANAHARSDEALHRQ
jgi:hypothetical protein